MSCTVVIVVALILAVIVGGALAYALVWPERQRAPRTHPRSDDIADLRAEIAELRAEVERLRKIVDKSTPSDGIVAGDAR